MTSLFLTLAQSTAPTSGPTALPPPGQFFSSGMMYFFIAIMVMWFIMFRSKKKTEGQRTSMLNQMKRGDRVQTIGGILGKVVDVEETKVLLKVDESANAKIWFSRNAIHRVISDDEKADVK